MPPTGVEPVTFPLQREHSSQSELRGPIGGETSTAGFEPTRA